MKKSITQTVRKTKSAILLVFLAFFCAFSLQAQNREMLISENFDGNSFPEGWTIVGAGQANWSISATDYAGGSANEAKLVGFPQFNGTTRLTTPELDLTGVESVIVSFKHSLDHCTGTQTIGIATSTDGIIWHSGWSQNITSIGVWSVNQVISTIDFGLENVRFCIYYMGSSYNIDNWYFDNVQILLQDQLDISLDKIDVPSNVASGMLPISFNVTNKGVEPITSLRVNYEIEGQETVSEDFTTNLTTFADTTLTFEEGTFLSPGDYILNVWISEVNGIANEGDDLSKTVSVATAFVQRQVMIEHFSSSTCGPCVSVNSQMLALTNSNPGKYCYVKYPMNWPGSGDPYYTAEAGIRRSFYGVDAVPSLKIEGGLAESITQNSFDQFYAEPAYVDIRGSFQIDGNTINIKADVFPNNSVSSVSLFVVVNEKVTHNNIGSNGETSFHHVMMKMLPDAQGTPIDLVAGEIQSFEFSQDMTSTHVEEITDLEVAIFIQNLSTHEIINSIFAYENTDIHPYPVENIQIVRDYSDLNISWDAHDASEPTGYMIRISGEVVEENYQGGTSYTYENAIENFYVVQIEAIYGEMNSVAVTKSYEDEECLPITELFGVQEEQNVVLTWATSATAVGYEIYRDEVLIATIENVASYTDVDVEDGTHTYSIVSVCPNGFTSEPVSVEVAVASNDCFSITELSGIQENQNVVLTWATSATAIGYEIYRDETLLATIGNVATYTDVDVEEGTYTYSVVSVCPNDLTSEPVFIEVVVVPNECFSVTELSGVQEAHNVILTWATSETAIGYEIYRDETLLETIGNVATYTDIDVEEGTHNYSIFSICPNGLISEPVSVEVVVDFTTIDELSASISIFPNPAGDYVKIEGKNIEIIHVYNTLGQLVKSVTVNNSSMYMSVSDLQQGIYFFDVKTSDAVIRNRVVISR